MFNPTSGQLYDDFGSPFGRIFAGTWNGPIRVYWSTMEGMSAEVVRDLASERGIVVFTQPTRRLLAIGRNSTPRITAR